MWAREVALRIADAVKASEVVSAATCVIIDGSEDENLRSRCATVVSRLASDDELRELKGFVRDTQPTTRQERATVSSLLQALLERGLWNAAQVYECMPEPGEEEVIDVTHVLPVAIQEALTADDALQILRGKSADEVAELNRAAAEGRLIRSLGDDPHWQLFATAVEKVATTPEAGAGSLKLVTPFLVSLPIGGGVAHSQVLFRILEGVRRSQEARRALCSELLERDRTSCDSAFRVSPSDVLCPGDVDWLLEQPTGSREERQTLLWVALRLAYREGAGRAVKVKMRRLLRDEEPELLHGFDRERRREGRQARRREREQAKRAVEERSLQEVNEEVLGSDRYTLQQRMWNLSWLNFCREGARPRNVVGEWRDLPEEQRQRILDVCEEALDSVQPTPLPEGTSFPASFVFEASCFVETVRERQGAFQLTAERVRRWLPGALAVPTEGATAVLEECFRAEEQATEEVLVAAVQRELRCGDNYSVLLQDLPQDLWTPRIVGFLSDWLTATDAPQSTKGRLLRLLARRAMEAGLELARTVIADRPAEALAEDDFALAALDVLLAADPERALPTLRIAVDAGGQPVLEAARSLYDRWGEVLVVKLESWSSSLLGQLLEVLLSAYPPAEDPELPRFGFVTPDQDLRLLRNRVFELLVRRDDPEALRYVEMVARQHPRLNDWRKRLLADGQASELLGRGPTHPPPERLPVKEVVRALDHADYRIIRNDRDLLRVVAEQLEEMGKHAGDHLPMLYLPEEMGGGPKPRHEEALQAYLACRLQDRLPGKVLDRECQVKFRRRLDIKVISPTVEPGRLATVVLETKWSNNSSPASGISTALTKQLGEKYLRQEGLSCGIFAVGWIGRLGTWRRRAGARPWKEDLPDSLQRALERQAREFRECYPEIEIRPVVLDLAWSAATE